MSEVERLRAIIPDVLAEELKAYELPAACVGFGLAEGEEQEAGRSKRVYVRSRIAGLDATAVTELGRRVAKRFPDPDLEEALHLIAEEGQSRLSEMTRRKVLNCLAETRNISGRLNLLVFLGQVFPLRTYPSGSLLCGTLEDEITKHMILNDDWDLEYLFERLKLPECSEHLFSQFMELCVHPMARHEEEQQLLVEQLNAILKPDGQILLPVETLSGEPVYRLVARTDGVSGYAKNLIFAADGPKPEIILQDAINNDARIVRNEEYCLVFDHPLGSAGLRWGDLVDWWSSRYGEPSRSREFEESLYNRLYKSLGSKPEKLLFREYYKRYHNAFGWELPALLPQVYLHYDPYTAQMRKNMQILSRQRMDFLLLFSPQERIVVEVDGQQHYSESGKPSPGLYADMVSADRALRLVGYEVYRFGGAELVGPRSSDVAAQFFDRLFMKHGVARDST